MKMQLSIPFRKSWEQGIVTALLSRQEQVGSFFKRIQDTIQNGFAFSGSSTELQSLSQKLIYALNQPKATLLTCSTPFENLAFSLNKALETTTLPLSFKEKGRVLKALIGKTGGLSQEQQASVFRTIDELYQIRFVDKPEGKALVAMCAALSALGLAFFATRTSGNAVKIEPPNPPAVQNGNEVEPPVPLVCERGWEDAQPLNSSSHLPCALWPLADEMPASSRQVDSPTTTWGNVTHDLWALLGYTFVLPQTLPMCKLVGSSATCPINVSSYVLNSNSTPPLLDPDDKEAPPVSNTSQWLWMVVNPWTLTIGTGLYLVRRIQTFIQATLDDTNGLLAAKETSPRGKSLDRTFSSLQKTATWIQWLLKLVPKNGAKEELIPSSPRTPLNQRTGSNRGSCQSPLAKKLLSSPSGRLLLGRRYLAPKLESPEKGLDEQPGHDWEFDPWKVTAASITTCFALHSVYTVYTRYIQSQGTNP